jgi:nucleoside-diphosphate-sugar epimerase
MTAIVLGGAGFIGSRLVDHLVARGMHVAVVDDLSTGSLVNLDYALSTGRVTFVFGDAERASDAALRALREQGRTPVVLFSLHGADLRVTGPALEIPAISLRWPGSPDSGLSPVVFGPRMPARSAPLVWQLFTDALAGEPTPLDGVPPHAIEMAYVENVVLDMVAAAQRATEPNPAVVPRVDVRLKPHELREALGCIPRETRSVRRHVRQRPAQAPVALDDALRATCRWFATRAG